MPHRFFIPADSITPPTVELRGETARHIALVLRLPPGEEIIVLDNSGQEWSVRLTKVARGLIQGQIAGQRPNRNEPNLKLTLYQGTLKNQKFEWILQKGTELGVTRFVPTICQRSIVRNPQAIVKKRTRWQQIIREAAEQSRRGQLPRLLEPLSLPETLRRDSPDTLRLIPWEEAGQPSLKEILEGRTFTQVALFIGPEGGFTAAEIDLMEAGGAEVVTMGPRILRAETAAIAACAAIFYENNDWVSPS